ncbi:MAG: hypothetical protein J5817_05555 [Treponema sp.]|nr:hypothetical protein [Treponema sp.]
MKIQILTLLRKFFLLLFCGSLLVQQMLPEQHLVIFYGLSGVPPYGSIAPQRLRRPSNPCRALICIQDFKDKMSFKKQLRHTRTILS